MTTTLTTRDAAALGTILDATKRQARVHWIDPNTGHLLTGIARHIVRDPENAYFLGDDDEIRDGYLRISATFEHFIPVRDVMQMVCDYVWFADA